MPNPTPDSYVFTPGVTLYVGMPTPGGSLLTTLTLENWSGSATRTLFRGGMPFKKGEVPAGSVPEIRRDGVAVAAQFDERTTWADGSLKFAVCHMRDVDLAAGASATYEIYAVSGSYDNTGATSLASVAAANALTVEFSSLAQWNGTSSATRGSGAALAALVDHAAVATRVTKVHSGPVCEGWMVWGMASDGADGSGSEDAHLKVEWYVDVWKDAGGNIIDVEHAAVIAQDWWGVANKFRLDYTATYKRIGSTVQAYTGIEHPYHSRWATVRTQDDNNHARRHWATSIPTLLYKPNRAYWNDTHATPGFDTTNAATANAAQTYSALGPGGHRTNIDDTGAYLGRGIYPNCDAKTFIRQTAPDVRSSRVNAFAGLHVPYHFRDERTRTRPSESADVANTLIPLLWEPKASSASTITGLPTPKAAYRGDASSTTDKGGYVNPTGGSGVWVPSINASHAVQYSLFMYLLEGERYFLDASVDLATAHVHILNANEFAAMPFIHWYANTDARAEMSIPATRWHAIPDFVEQERSIGWAVNLLAAAAFVPDNDPQGTYMRGWAAHCGDYLNECVTYTPPSLASAGTVFCSLLSVSGTMRNPWQEAFIIMCCAQTSMLTEIDGFKQYANMVARSTAAIVERNKYDLTMYRWMQAAIIAAYPAGGYFSAANYLIDPVQVTVSGNVLSIAGTTAPHLYANGDTGYFVARSGAPATVSLPSGYTEGTQLYVVEVSGAPFRVALTSGGAPIAVPDGTYQFAGRPTGRAAIDVADFPPYLPSADDYPPIHEAAFAVAETAGCESVPAGTAASVRAFLANVDRTGHPEWTLTVVG